MYCIVKLKTVSLGNDPRPNTGGAVCVWRPCEDTKIKDDNIQDEEGEEEEEM